MGTLSADLYAHFFHTKCVKEKWVFLALNDSKGAFFFVGTVGITLGTLWTKKSGVLGAFTKVFGIAHQLSQVTSTLTEKFSLV